MKRKMAVALLTAVTVVAQSVPVMAESSPNESTTTTQAEGDAETSETETETETETEAEIETETETETETGTETGTETETETETESESTDSSESTESTELPETTEEDLYDEFGNPLLEASTDFDLGVAMMSELTTIASTEVTLGDYKLTADNSFTSDATGTDETVDCYLKDDALYINTSTPITIQNTNLSTPSKQPIVVKDEITGGANITFNGVNVAPDKQEDVNDDYGDPIEGSGGVSAVNFNSETTLTIAKGSTNTLQGSEYGAGIANYSLSLVIQGDDGDDSGVLTTTGGKHGAGIGGATGTVHQLHLQVFEMFWSDVDPMMGMNITINGGTINAEGGEYGAGIGGGNYQGADITINGGNVTAIGGGADSEYGYAAGIGGGGTTSSGTGITITGGTVNATGTGQAAAIGGSGYSGTGWGITISGGTVTATSGTVALDGSSSGTTVIGTSGNASGGNIVISGGTVRTIAVSSGKTSSISGGGIFDEGENDFSTGENGNAVIIMENDNANASYGIANSSSWSGVIFEHSTNGKVYGDVELTTDATIPDGYSLAIESGKSLSIAQGTTLTNEGTITNAGALEIANTTSLVNDGSGSLTGNGDYRFGGHSFKFIVLNPVPYTSKVITVEEVEKQVVITDSAGGGGNELVYVCGQYFTPTEEITMNNIHDYYTPLLASEITNVEETSYLVYTSEDETINIIPESYIFGIEKSDSTGSVTTTDTNTISDGSTLTYGQAYTVKYTPEVMTMSDAPAKTVELYYGDTQITTTSNPTDGNVVEGEETALTFTVDKAVFGNATFDGATEVELKLKWGGDDNLNANELTTFKVKLQKSELTAVVDESDASASKPYDGLKTFENVKLILTGGYVNGDDVTATASGNRASSDVVATDAQKAFVDEVSTLSGADAGYYTLPANQISGKLEITPLDIANLLPSDYTPPERTYTGEAQTLVLTDLQNESIEKVEYANNTDVPAAGEKQEPTATATFTGKNNYTGTLVVPFHILKAEYDGEITHGYVSAKYGTDRSIPLYNDANPQLQGVVFGTTNIDDPDKILVADSCKVVPVVKDGKTLYELEFTMVDDEEMAKADPSYTATVGGTISSQNYKDFEAGVTISLISKNTQSVNFESGYLEKAYDDTKFTNLATVSKTHDSDTGTLGTITYESKNTAVATVDATTGEVTLVGVGKATIYAYASETDEFALTGNMYELVVKQATPTYTTPTIAAQVYKTTLESISLPTGFSFQDSLSTEVGEVGTHEFLVKYTPSDTVNYSSVTDIPVSIAVTKADYTSDTTSKTTVNTDTEGSVSLESWARAIDPTFGTLAVSDASMFLVQPVLLENRIAFTMTADTSKAGGTATISVPVTTKNYKDFTIVVTVTLASGKIIPTVTAQDYVKIYNGQEIPISELTLSSTHDGKKVEGEWKFAVHYDDKPDEYSLTSDHSKDVTYTDMLDLHFFPTDTETYAEIETSVSVDITKKDATVIVVDKFISPGDPDPEFSFITDGFVERTTDDGTSGMEGLLTDPILVCDKHSEEYGLYPIYAETLGTASTNYNLRHVSGYLHIAVLYTVTFDTVGGSTIATQDVHDGDVVKTVEGPTQTGYVFTGWTLEGETFDWTTPITGDITLVATWEVDTNGNGEDDGSLENPEDTGNAGGSGGSLTSNSTTRPSTDSDDTVTGTDTTPSTGTSSGMSTGTSSPTAESFIDIVGHWAEDAINFMAEEGLMFGVSEEKFAPDAPMTRGMFVTVLGRLSGEDIESFTGNSFVDVATGSYYQTAIEWARANGIVYGVSATEFAPDVWITREQMSFMLKNYLEYLKITLPQDEEKIDFVDDTYFSSYAADAIQDLQMSGIVSGKGNDTFDPKGNGTRAEFSSMMQRFVTKVSQITKVLFC